MKKTYENHGYFQQFVGCPLEPTSPRAAAHPEPLPPPVAGPKFPAGNGVLGRIVTSLLKKWELKKVKKFWGY